MEEIADEIYKMILDNLHVTYKPDNFTESRLKNEISAGIAYIKQYCNPDADFSPGTRFGQLLCDYVLRAESGAAETFAMDFAEDITAARMEYEAKRYAEALGYA